MPNHSTDVSVSALIAWRLAALVFTGAVAGSAGCAQPAAVGAPCDLGIPAAGGSVTISSPVLECAGGVCMQVGDTPALCTAACQSDDDCRTVATSPSGGGCKGGFTCASATAVGSYACHPLCVCRDSLPATVGCTPGPEPSESLLSEESKHPSACQCRLGRR